MSKSGVSRAEANRAIRRKNLREELSNKGLINHVLDIEGKLRDLSIELESTDVTRLKAAADLNLGLIKKYLPDVKQTEITGEDGEDIRVQLQTKRLTVVGVDADDK